MLVAQLGPFNAEFFGLTVDPFHSGALVEKLLVCGALAVELVAGCLLGAVTHTGGQRGDAAAVGPVFVGNGAGLAGCLRKEQGTDVATDLVGDEAVA